MKITALEEYGLRCMMLFARQKPGMALTLNEISSRENLSLPYAAKLLMILRKAGLVVALRGRNGGYRLAIPADNIRLHDVLKALGEPLFGPHHCRRYAGDGEECVHIDDCSVKYIWGAFDRYMNEVLREVTLAELADREFKPSRIISRDKARAEGAESAVGHLPVNENKGRI